MIDINVRSRAHGCMLGQLAGDSLGSLVEFCLASEIRERYPDGVCEMEAGGTYNTLPGQPTDDSEMALMLARSLADMHTYNPKDVFEHYRFWLESKPFDCGNTIRRALMGLPADMSSQANGALMRVSPLGIFGWNASSDILMNWAMQDAALTHPNIICRQVNALYVRLIAVAIRTGDSPGQLYEKLMHWCEEANIRQEIRTAVYAAALTPPNDFFSQCGWVLTAFQNAVYQMLHAPKFKKGVVDTVMYGGDTDTNAAIAGALLGAIHGERAVPRQWKNALMSCRPTAGSMAFHPRPRCFWPQYGLELADRLLQAGGDKNAGASDHLLDAGTQPNGVSGLRSRAAM